MAQSRSGKSTGSSSRRSSSSTRGSSSGKKAASSASRSRSASARENVSRRAQRRKERNSVMGSIPLAAIGILAIAFVIVPGQSVWSAIRSGLFGVFGILTYFVGPFLIYVAYLMASGYLVGKFVAKAFLLALVCSSVPVVFSAFKIGDSSFIQVVQTLFAWGQTRFWAGGVVGGVIGATLVALCGRPASNFVMILLFLTGLMVFFAVTPRDVVQFIAYQVARWKQSRANAYARETEYDTPLFSGEPEEEPIENLTGGLPAEEQNQVPHHPAFNAEPYLEQDEARLARRRAAAQQQTVQQPSMQPTQPPVVSRPAAAAAPAAPAVSAAPQQDTRASFDVDLGPDMSDRMLHEALEHDPLQPVEIGPGGTFGLDPLLQLGHEKQVQQKPLTPPPSPAPQRQEEKEDFSLHLESAPKQDSASQDELDDLIRKAMAGIPEEADENHVGEIHLDVEAQKSAVVQPQPEPQPVVQPEPQGTRDVIPTLGGSFEAARDAWNAGRPIGAVLAGTAPSAPQPTMSQATSVNDAYSETASDSTGRLRVSSSIGNTASEPIHTPPRADKATPVQTTEKGEAQPDLAELAKTEVQPYCYPSLNLFNPTKPEDDAGAAREMKKNADTLVRTLDSFGVKTRIMDICRGPSVTRYELQPQAGVKISRITNLADDIALNLATAGVRIEAPIPGKPAVGIEVPNRIRTAVNIRSVFESPNYINMRSPLTMALGKDIAGTAQVADLCKMPHLLIAGSTGSGKSVCVNSIIISFLFRSSPEDVKLILIDPKVVELAEYNGIPHLLMPVVTEPRKAAGALGASVAEMERRYKLFAENNVRDIKSYNKLAASSPVLEHLPYIAIVIDELADLMMVAGKEVEDYICRIAQKARAAGIHLIIATQRPSVDVITGLIKANIPSRIAFAVSSQIDSRTILDSGGAEKLLGNGDMLFLPVGAPKPVRIQGTYVTDEEISAVLNFIKATSSAQYDEEMIAEMERRAVAEKGSHDSGDDSDGGSAHDPMFDQAVECVIDAGQASTSLLQRRCKLGYARAARIMDQMEQEGIIGPYEGAKPRSVLVTCAQWQERKLGAPEEE